MCKKCGKNNCKCCPPKAISSTLSRGKAGPRGPRGPKGADGQGIGGASQIVSQSALWGGIAGSVGTTGVGTLFSNLESNFFSIVPKFCSISIGLTVTAGAPHKVIAYFKKNNVQVGPIYEKSMYAKDYLFFQTELIQFSTADTLKLYIESTAMDCQVLPGHLLNYKQL